MLLRQGSGPQCPRHVLQSPSWELAEADVVQDPKRLLRIVVFLRMASSVIRTSLIVRHLEPWRRVRCTVSVAPALVCSYLAY